MSSKHSSPLGCCNVSAGWPVWKSGKCKKDSDCSFAETCTTYNNCMSPLKEAVSNSSNNWILYGIVLAVIIALAYYFFIVRK